MWRDRWEKILEPEWDWRCDLGGPATSGYDWTIQTQVIPRHGMVCVVPDASRSQNIGQFEGWATNPQSWAYSQAKSFREFALAPIEYRLEVPCLT